MTPEEIAKMVVEEYTVSEFLEQEMEESIPQFDPKPSILVTVEEYDEWCRPWKMSLIVKLMGKRLSLRFMDSWIMKKWGRKGSVKVLDLTNDFYLVRFAEEEDYNFALFEGPWMIADHYLLVQRWRPLFKPKDETV